MKICQFNFNNEVNTFTIHVEEDGRVSVPGENNEILAEYDSIEQMAELYAQARDVKPENLKNWILLQNGNVYSFVLRAGTAGVNVSEVEGRLEEVFASLAGTYHPLNIARAKEQVMSDGTRDLTEVLVHCTETDIARDVYDAMSGSINGTADVPAEAPEEEVDTRTDLEKYVDSKFGNPGAVALIATMAGVDRSSDRDTIVAALDGNMVLSNVNVLKAAFDNMVSEAINNGIGVDSVDDALTVITQTAAGQKDDALKSRLVNATRMAGRNGMNIRLDIAGHRHIRHTAELVPLDEIENADLLVCGSVPYIVRFSDTIDAELEAERDAAAQREADAEGQDGGEHVVDLDVEDFYGDEEGYGYDGEE